MANRNFFPQLEALRGIASVVVLIHHFMLGFTPRLHGLLYPDQSFSLMGTPAFALVNGSAAVVLFFVLSGFVLTINLLRGADFGRAIVAIVKRWPRLAASAMLANLAAGCLMAFGVFRKASVAKVVPSMWLGGFYTWDSTGLAEVRKALWEGATTFFSGSAAYNGNIWTMYYEFWGSIIAIGCAVACMTIKTTSLRNILLFLIWLIDLRYSPYLSSFVAGVWLAQLHVQQPYRILSGWRVYILALLAVLLLGYHENLVSGRSEGIYGFLNPIVQQHALSLRVVLHSLAAAIVMLLFLYVESLRNAMSGRVGRTLGYMSFAIYLVQMLVIFSVSSMTYGALHGSTDSLRVAVTLLVTIVGTILLAAPVAAFDKWWVSSLNRQIRRFFAPLPSPQES